MARTNGRNVGVMAYIRNAI